MKEYIEREAALDIAAEWCPDDDGSVGKTGDLREMLDELEAIPAADVVEVRHGQWIKSESSGLYKCSKCGRYATNSDVLNWEYCNCGAKMDGGADDGRN